MKVVLATLFVYTLIAMLVILSGCVSVSMKTSDGTTVNGSVMNGAVSVSNGPGCAPAVPNSTVPAPAIPVPMTAQAVCEGGSCVHFMAAAPPPVCNTQVVNVRGTDFGDYAKYVLGGILGGVLLFK